LLPFRSFCPAYFCIEIPKYMKREIVKIDENLCNGCGECVPGCLEGALQIIDGKARLVSDLLCDGLGSCLGYCPQGAIEIEVREAEPYNETKVMEIMARMGKNTVIAHMKHLKEHNETEFLKEAVSFLTKNTGNLDFDPVEVINEVHHHGNHQGGGCMGSKAMTIHKPDIKNDMEMVSGASELRNWPVQMHLINPSAAYFKKSDLLLAADCTAFSSGNFHQGFLKGKTLIIACPKLDEGINSYIEKVRSLIDTALINTITVLRMQVPCCGGLLQIVNNARSLATRNIPVKEIVVSIEGEVLSEEWK